MSLSVEDADLLRAYPAFVYDEKRKFNQLCLIFKMIGFGFYSRTAIICVNDKLFSWFCMVSGTMFVSICNTLRYEYAFYKVYGTTFQSIDAFKSWKTQQKPHIKTVLDCVEFILKAVYFYKSLPLTFSMYDDTDDKKFSECVFCGTLLKLHVMIIMAGYSVVVLFLTGIYTDFAFRRLSSPRQPMDAQNQNAITAVRPIAIVIDNETECCICLEKNENHWITAHCTHAFHAKCILEWEQRNQSCPICRSNLILNA
jgi:hypothetical protein